MRKTHMADDHFLSISDYSKDIPTSSYIYVSVLIHNILSLLSTGKSVYQIHLVNDLGT